ncbi:MAG: anti-CBASS protein Acb1 family protein, partial [Candidatus Saliniplasma sp.]
VMCIEAYELTKEVSKSAYLDGMALIYLNYDGDENLQTEPDAVKEVKQAGVIYHKDVEDYNLEEDLSSEKFNEVTSWRVSVGSGQDVIHSSRVIHVIYDTIYDDPWGISKISPEFDYHVFRQVIVESMVSTFYQNSSGIKAFSLPDKATKKEREFLEKNINKLREKAEIIIPNGTEISHPAPEIADSSKILEHLMETSTSMPFPLLTGVNAGAVTGSETNLRIYYIEIQKKRRRTINDMLVGKLKYLQEKGALSEGGFELK